MQVTLSSHQKKILDFIEDYIERYGFPPTYEIIGKKFNYAGKSSVQHHVQALMAKGLLTKERKLSNGVSIHKQQDDSSIPLLGKVAAGLPIDYKIQNQRIEVPKPMLKGGQHFALKVSGDSMIDEGIFDGDYVIIRKQESADDGNIIVAEIDEEATIKRFFKKHNHVELHSANPKYKPLIITADRLFRIAGVFRGLIRY